jgi:hypothetical protein
MTHAIAERRGIRAYLEGFSMTKALEGGVVAGLIGGCFVALWSMVSAASAGYGLLFPFNLIGATFNGPQALIGGTGVILWGLSVHVVASVMLGILYAFMVRPEVQNITSLIGGVIYGMAILAVMSYVVLPWANPVLHQRVWMMPTSWFLIHAVFGLGVASVPMLERHLGKRAPPPAEPPATTV